jgi:hypothetical protein
VNYTVLLYSIHMIHPGNQLPERAEQFDEYFGAPAAYTVSQEWGRVLVTEEAQASYGIVSFAPNTLIGNAPSELDPERLVEMALLGPSELVAVEAPPRPEPKLDTFPASIFTYLQEDGRAQLVLGYAIDSEEMLKVSLAKVARREAVSVEEVERGFVDEASGDSATLSLEREILQTITHAPLPVVRQALFNLLVERGQQYGSRRSRLFSDLFGGNIRLAIQAGIITEDFHDTFCRERFEHHFNSAE